MRTLKFKMQQTISSDKVETIFYLFHKKALFTIYTLAFPDYVDYNSSQTCTRENRRCTDTILSLIKLNALLNNGNKIRK